MSSWLGALLDLIYPGTCAVCGDFLTDGEKYICEDCMKDLPLTYFWSWRDNPAEEMLWGRTYFDKVCSLFFYSRDNDYSAIVRKIKYSGQTALGLYMGTVLGELMREDFSDVDYIVPVPVHFRRRWKRGYNQAEFIAKGICRGLGRGEVLLNVLRRSRFAHSQTNVTMGSKWGNVKGTFSLRRGKIKIPNGAHIILVDDVLTSGATSEVCFDALSKIGNVRISLATLAFVKK